MKTLLAPVDGVLIHIMKDLQSAEDQLRTVLPRMWEAATSAALAETLRKFLHDSVEHDTGLAQMREDMGDTSGERHWSAMAATIQETLDIALAVEDSLMRDLLLISGSLRIKGLKIAAYGAARTLAEARSCYQLATPLQTMLTTEMEGDLELMELAHNTLLCLGLAGH